jgi:hypothetical protein
MEAIEIEKLKQLVSRTDMSGNQKVEWLVDFINKPKIYEITFDNHVKALIKINNNIPFIVASMNGYGNAISDDKITVYEQPIS